LKEAWRELFKEMYWLDCKNAVDGKRLLLRINTERLIGLREAEKKIGELI
jgi:hypothetical protein